MNEQTLKNEMIRIEAAGLRTFKANHIPIFLHDFRNIEDNQFSRYVSDYIELENPPKSFTGWILKRFKEDNQQQYQEQELSWTKSQDGKYMREQAKTFLQIVCKMMIAFKGTGSYLHFTEALNAVWMNNSGNKLTEKLSEFSKELEKFIKPQKQGELGI